MIFSRKAILAGAIALAGICSAAAQTRISREEYIERYKSIAVAQMERCLLYTSPSPRDP